MADTPTVAVVGAGIRGTTYARVLLAHGLGRVVAVAEPDPARRRTFADRFEVAPGGEFADWHDLAASPRLSDAVFVTTQDGMHYEPTVALLRNGYHVLVEKPMATTEAECAEMVDVAESSKVILGACHVLRYTPYTRALTQLIDSGLIGEVVSVEHLEPVGWWHHAHSYVRGSWRREDESTNMLMAKSVHDVDWLGQVVRRPARKVSSFGGLYHFRPEQRPEAAADRCVDCPVEPVCPYSAPRLYLSCLDDHDPDPWPLSAVTDERTPEGVLEVLRHSPYGRCVYACDNDVVDHQVVNIEYDGGVTASFSMVAFTPYTFRQTRVFGTHGCLDGDGRSISTTDFRTGDRGRVEVSSDGGPDAGGGHGGGDAGLIRAFVDAIVSGDPDEHLVPARESLESHRLTWAAERARRTSSVVDLTRRTEAPA